MKNSFSFPALAWILLTAICIIILLLGLKAALKRTNWENRKRHKIFWISSVSILSWTILLLLLSTYNFFEVFSPFPRPVLAILIPLPIVLAIAFSKTGTQLVRSTPSHWLVFMQSFRIAVELLLVMAFINGKIPVQMTFEGRNYDILTGIFALPVGYLLMKKKSYAAGLAIAFNIVGFLLLINILAIAVLSMPTPIRYFMNEPANTIVSKFPFILLPGVLVPIAYTMSIFSLRQLLVKEKTVPSLDGAVTRIVSKATS